MNKEMIKRLREYGFPLWAICKCLKIHHNDYDKALDELKKIYGVIGDNPVVVIKRNEEELRNGNFCGEKNALQIMHTLI